MAQELKCECGTCRTCKGREYRRIWRANNPDAGREYYAKHRDKELQRGHERYRNGGLLKYRQRNGIVDAHLVDEVLAEQGGVCAICKAAEPGGNGAWHADHDHKTGLLRGVLCNICNPGLGYFRDSIEKLFAAILYLLFPPAQRVRERKS